MIEHGSRGNPPEQYDLLVTGGLVLCCDAAGSVVENAAVAVVGDRIAAVGPVANFSSSRARKVIDAKGGIVLPGLINTHTHAAMTLFRGLADDLPLMTWLEDHIFPAEAKLTQEAVYWGAQLACAEMIRSGTTCFCDMYLFAGSVARAVADAGMRALVGEVLFDFPSANYGPLAQGLAYTEALIEKWAAHPLVSVAVEPHSPYLCAASLLEEAADLAARHQVPLITHLSETRGEVAQVRKRYGKTPVQHLADLGVLSDRLIAAHCVVLTEDDLTLLRRFDVKVSHNPESNMKLASGIAPVRDMLARGICVGLGTDGCASNNDLDLFAEMNTAAKLHKVHALDPTVTSAAEVLCMSTRSAARVLGMTNKIGTLETGKQADLIVIDTCQPHLVPMYHPVSHLVYAARGGDVITSVIGGRVVMEDRRLTTIDEAVVIKEARRLAAAITGRLL